MVSKMCGVCVNSWMSLCGVIRTNLGTCRVCVVRERVRDAGLWQGASPCCHPFCSGLVCRRRASLPRLVGEPVARCVWVASVRVCALLLCACVVVSIY